MDPAGSSDYLQQDLTPNAIAALALFGILGSTAVGLRFLSRRLMKVKLWWDDWLALLAGVVLVGASAVAIYAGTIGLGKHLARVEEEAPQNIEPFLKWIFSAELTYAWIIGPVKCSILMLYIRLFGINRNFRHICYGLVAITVGWSAAAFFSAIFQCHPVSLAWDPAGDRTNCLDLRSVLVGINVPNIIIDFTILVLPLYPIWNLKLPVKKRVWISLVLMLGAGEIAFSVVRLIMLTSLNTTDITWDYYTPTLWSVTEMGVGVLCACLPVFGVLLPKRLIGSLSRKNKTEQSLYKGNNYVLSSTRRKFDQLDDEVAGLTSEGQSRSMPISKTTEVTLTSQPRSETRSEAGEESQWSLR